VLMVLVLLVVSLVAGGLGFREAGRGSGPVEPSRRLAADAAVRACWTRMIAPAPLPALTR